LTARQQYDRAYRLKRASQASVLHAPLEKSEWTTPAEVRRRLCETFTTHRQTGRPLPRSSRRGCPRGTSRTRQVGQPGSREEIDLDAVRYWTNSSHSFTQYTHGQHTQSARLNDNSAVARSNSSSVLNAANPFQRFLFCHTGPRWIFAYKERHLENPGRDKPPARVSTPARVPGRSTS